jgi:hypothetical protein
MTENKDAFIESTEPKYYCYNHPQRETWLRCNRCDRPICSECAVLTPTGYRCKECIRGQQKHFDTAQWLDYPLAVATAGVLSFLGSYLAGFLWFFILMAAPIVGVVIAEAVRWVVRRRRSKLLWQVTTVAVVVGSLPLLVVALLPLFLGGSLGSLITLLFRGAYTLLVTTSFYYRLTGIRLGR